MPTWWCCPSCSPRASRSILPPVAEAPGGRSSRPCAAGPCIRQGRRGQRRRRRRGPLLQPDVFRDARRRCARYDKRHLFAPGGESGTTRPAATAWWSDTGVSGFCCSSAMTCGSRFGAVAAGDYDAILCCASWPASRREAWRTLLHARAVENQCYVAGVNRVGDDPRGITPGIRSSSISKGRTPWPRPATGCGLPPSAAEASPQFRPRPPPAPRRLPPAAAPAPQALFPFPGCRRFPDSNVIRPACFFRRKCRIFTHFSRRIPCALNKRGLRYVF